MTSEFRRTKNLIVADFYSTEIVKDILDWLRSKRIFSVFDLDDGFFQVERLLALKDYRATYTVLGLLQCKGIPKCLKISSKTF